MDLLALMRTIVTLENKVAELEKRDELLQKQIDEMWQLQGKSQHDMQAQISKLNGVVQPL